MLTDSQIKRIQNEIEKQDISFSHLKDDIIDHLSCEIENEMMKGMDFDSAFRNIFEDIGNDGIKKIEKETTFLIDYKIYMRRKGIFRIATAGIALFVAGVVFQLIDFRISKFFQLKGIFILLGFIPLFFINNLLRKAEKTVFFNVTGLFTSMVTIGAILFTIQNWRPFKELLFLLSVLSLLILFVPTYAWNIHKYKWNKIIHLSFIYFMIMFLSLQLSSYLNNKNNPANALIHHETNTEAYLNYYNTEIRKMTDSLLISSNNYQKLHELSVKLTHNIDTLKEKILKRNKGILKIDFYSPYDYENDFHSLISEINEYRDLCISQIADQNLKRILNRSFPT